MVFSTEMVLSSNTFKTLFFFCDFKLYFEILSVTILILKIVDLYIDYLLRHILNLLII